MLRQVYPISGFLLHEPRGARLPTPLSKPPFWACGTAACESTSFASQDRNFESTYCCLNETQFVGGTNRTPTTPTNSMVGGTNLMKARPAISRRLYCWAAQYVDGTNCMQSVPAIKLVPRPSFFTAHLFAGPTLVSTRHCQRVVRKHLFLGLENSDLRKSSYFGCRQDRNFETTGIAG